MRSRITYHPFRGSINYTSICIQPRPMYTKDLYIPDTLRNVGGPSRRSPLEEQALLEDPIRQRAVSQLRWGFHILKQAGRC